jgi:meso-butanediol dehydrogenase/(S,S)-butanediol dehydrogenase/diacetyl reductase
VRRVALVTGASRGIGLACAEAFVSHGWAVVMVARGAGPLALAAGRLGDAAVAVPGDVAAPPVNWTAVAAAVERFGRLDAVVGNAGVTLAKTIDDTTDNELEHVLAVNVKALVHLAQASHEALGRSKGSFHVIASNKGLVAQRGSPIYVATKGAAVQLARALALDWAPEGIRVNALCPGLVDTAMLRSFAAAAPDPDKAMRRLRREQPLGRLAEPAECAETVVFLASPAAAFISGVALPLDGGFTAQ